MLQVRTYVPTRTSTYVLVVFVVFFSFVLPFVILVFVVLIIAVLIAVYWVPFLPHVRCLPDMVDGSGASHVLHVWSTIVFLVATPVPHVPQL